MVLYKPPFLPSHVTRSPHWSANPSASAPEPGAAMTTWWSGTQKWPWGFLKAWGYPYFRKPPYGGFLRPGGSPNSMEIARWSGPRDRDPSFSAVIFLECLHWTWSNRSCQRIAHWWILSGLLMANNCQLIVSCWLIDGQLMIHNG